MISGGIYSRVNSINEYFHLKSENTLLNEENARLKNLLEKKKVELNSKLITVIDTSNYAQKYEYSIAKVINNNYTKRNNFLTLNVGTKNNIKTDLGVINSRGVIGVIKNISTNYATVLSILNSSSKLNVRLKNSAHFGTLVWNGKNYNKMQITDIPRQTILKKGDTIITGGKSAIFPEGINIGVIDNFEIVNNQYKQIDVLLFNDMSAISQVQIVENLEKNEQLKLEQKSNNE